MEVLIRGVGGVVVKVSAGDEEGRLGKGGEEGVYGSIMGVCLVSRKKFVF